MFSDKHLEAILQKMTKSTLNHLTDKLNKEHIKKVVEQPVELIFKHLVDNHKK